MRPIEAGLDSIAWVYGHKAKAKRPDCVSASSLWRHAMHESRPGSQPSGG
jgi:hypothetical protein